MVVLVCIRLNTMFVIISVSLSDGELLFLFLASLHRVIDYRELLLSRIILLTPVLTDMGMFQ